jgi:uncharacterized protein YbjT (DUF2867 family)
LRVLLLGASGLIGTAVAARLAAAGHDVTALVRARNTASRRLPVSRFIHADLARLTRIDDWRPHLAGHDAVVNCAGVLQGGGGDSPATVHRDAPSALWQACRLADVRRVIQVSAIGVDRGGMTSFSTTKAEGDAALAATDLDWVILRPSVVVGRPAYGGSALFRGLAALPWLPVPPATGLLDIVQLDDVAETVVRLLVPGAPARVALELAGPDRLSFPEVIALYRRWLGWRPAREVRLPAWLLAIGWRLGDLAGRLGWRAPMRSTARRELERGATGDNRTWVRLTGIEPRGLAAALAAEPASVQERWFARIYWLKPVALVGFAAFWIATGLNALGPGWDRAVASMRATDAAAWAEATVLLGALFDLAVGALILVRRTARLALLIAFVATLFYLLFGTFLMPSLWSDPLGPLVKIVPILILNLFCLATLDDR